MDSITLKERVRTFLVDGSAFGESGAVSWVRWLVKSCECPERRVPQPPVGPGFEESLRQRARLVANALEDSAGAAVAGLAAIDDWRAALMLESPMDDIVAGIEARCVELAFDVRRVEATKAAAFDAELVALDNALEAAARVRDITQDVAVTLSDVTLPSVMAPLVAKLEEFDELVRRTVTPPALLPQSRLLVLLPPALHPLSMASIASAYVSANLISTEDIVTGALAAWVSPDADVAFDVTVTGQRGSFDDVVETLTRHLVVEAVWLPTPRSSMEDAAAPDAAPEPGVSLHAHLAALGSGEGGVRVTLPLPRSSTKIVRVRIEAIRLGRSLLVEQPRVVCVGLRVGVQAPLTLRDMSVGYQTPSISADGTVYIPKDAKVVVFNSAGESGVSLDAAPLGFRYPLNFSLYDDDSDTLLVGADHHAASRLVAIDARTHELRWALHDGAFSNLDAAAILHGLGLVIVCQYAGHVLTVLRISDGTIISSLTLPSYPAFVATDRDTRAVFASVGGAVHELQWDEQRQELVDKGAMPGLLARSSRPLAVVPAIVPGGVAHLVVGDYNSPKLWVVPLPFRVSPGVPGFVEHVLPNMGVVGLAADAAGSALLVMDARSRDGLVLPWPLHAARS